VFSERVWSHAVGLVVGAILSPEKRTVIAALQVMGLTDEKQFGKYHRVLSRAVWSSLELSRIVLGLVVTLLLSADSPLPIVLDETLERAARGKDPRHRGLPRRGALHQATANPIKRSTNNSPPPSASTVRRWPRH
jgi:hypothetical protein